MNRSQILHAIQQNPQMSILIIGGGINGIGTFRDLALNGVDTLLIDRGDFCSGASASSSHMAHGGIRYLENGEFHLVCEAVQERNRMIENAPHQVRPLPTTIPIYKYFSGLFNAPFKFLGWLDKPAERGALVIKIGLMLYDNFTHSQGTIPTHNLDNRKKALKKFPRLNPDILYTATYYDGSIFSPERLALDILLDGEAEGEHAKAINYVSLTGINGDHVILRDEVTKRQFSVNPRLIINSTGPWIDIINQIIGLQTRYIIGTKGSHLIIDNSELLRAIGNHEFFFENKDGRIVLIFPLGDKVLIGTSDIPIENPDKALCTEEEVAYFLEMINRVFPDIQVIRDQIVFRFSGVRPLAFANSKNTGQISRDHYIGENYFNNLPVFSLIGGKWTSYRSFSEQVVDKALAFLKLPRKADTKSLPIGGGKNYPETEYLKSQYFNAIHGETGLLSEWIKIFFDRYGTRVKEVASYVVGNQDKPLKYKPDITKREIQFIAEMEKVIHLDDILLRRTMLAYLGQLTYPLIEEIADALSEILRWSSKQKQTEVKRTLKILADKHGVNLSYV